MVGMAKIDELDADPHSQRDVVELRPLRSSPTRAQHGTQPLRRGAVNERNAGEPARNAGTWGVAVGWVALT